MVLSLLLDFLFPKRCAGCGKFGSFLCASCFSTISFNDSYICPICLGSSIAGSTHPICKTRYSLDGLISSFIYKGVIRKLVQRFKYKPYLSSLERVLGRLTQESLEQNETFYKIIKENPLVLPVPLHKSRERARGYNHAALLANHVAQYFSLEYEGGALTRIRNTKPQFKLKKDDRIQNIKGAFAVRKNGIEKIKGRMILLIDDVATTCSTLRECANVLKRNGAREVWGITFAREL